MSRHSVLIVSLYLLSGVMMARAGEFQTHVDYKTGRGGVFAAGGDFWGDGRLDLVTANYASDTASVLLGSGNGTFQPHVDYGTGRVPDSVAVGDFNGDGKLDLVVANAFSHTVGI